MGAGLVLPESPVKSLGEALAFFDTLRGRRLQNKVPAEAISDLQPQEWFAKFVNDRTVDIQELAAATLLCAAIPACAKVSLLFTWFDLDGDMQLSNFDLLHAYGAARRGLTHLGVAPELSEEELRTGMEKEVCRMYLCYYKQVPPPTDHFSLPDILRWCAMDPHMSGLLEPTALSFENDIVSGAAAALEKEAAAEKRKAKAGAERAEKKGALTQAQERAAAKLLPKAKAHKSVQPRSSSRRR